MKNACKQGLLIIGLNSWIKVLKVDKWIHVDGEIKPKEEKGQTGEQTNRWTARRTDE